MNQLSPARVSVHGGHSGQFCHHAKDSLAAVVEAYVEQGFDWVGITEHMPPLDARWRYPDEVESALSAEGLQEQFRHYFAECRRLQAEYADRIMLFTAFETETYPGSADYVQRLIEETQPDYIVGSVHHVAGISIDVNRELYASAVAQAGGVAALYQRYFDEQFAMLQALKPAVVGHFDLVRIFDPDYLDTLMLPEVWSRIERNLDYIADQDFIMDFNLRGYDKSTEQYPAMPVLGRAFEKGIAIVPGDDSHGVSSVGRNYDQGVTLLAALGHDCRWRQPRRYTYD